MKSVISSTSKQTRNLREVNDLWEDLLDSALMLLHNT